MDHERLKRLFAEIKADHPSEMLVDLLGPIIERRAAREPDNPTRLRHWPGLRGWSRKFGEPILARMRAASCQKA